MEALRALNLALRFFLELGALAAAGYWGATAPANRSIRILLAIAAPAAIAVLWGMFIAPKARMPTGLYGRSGLGFVVFSVAAVALLARGHVQLATTYWGLALVSSILLVVWRQQTPGSKGA